MRVQLEKRGVLGAGQVKKGGSLPRHIPILNIYVSTPPPGLYHAIRRLTMGKFRWSWTIGGESSFCEIPSIVRYRRIIFLGRTRSHDVVQRHLTI